MDVLFQATLFSLVRIRNYTWSVGLNSLFFIYEDILAHPVCQLSYMPI
jgi:hypothetical protein